jgi:hypothetical protein
MKNELSVDFLKASDDMPDVLMACECLACGWSNAIELKRGGPQTVFERCPVCGNEALEIPLPESIVRLLAFMDTLK